MIIAETKITIITIMTTITSIRIATMTIRTSILIIRTAAIIMLIVYYKFVATRYSCDIIFVKTVITFLQWPECYF